MHVLDAPLDADVGGHLVNRRRIEGGAEANGLRKLRGAVHGHAVQRLAPPVVCGYVEPGNGASLVYQLAGLLVQSHAVHQVSGANLGRQTGIQVGRLSCAGGCLLCFLGSGCKQPCAGCHRGSCHNSRKRCHLFSQGGRDRFSTNLATGKSAPALRLLTLKGAAGIVKMWAARR